MKLSKEEENLIYLMTEKITGSCQSGNFKKDIIIGNVAERMVKAKCHDLKSYVNLLSQDSEEYEAFISAITIHTTSWFRESPHFDFILNYIRSQVEKGNNSFNLRSTACSTGEEVYSIALALFKLRAEMKASWDFKVHGTDIDPVSVAIAEDCIFATAHLSQIPKNLHSYLLLGSGPYAGKFTLDKEIRRRCSFALGNMSVEDSSNEKVDVVICRNVLIYFSPTEVNTIVGNICKPLRPGGILVLGHSEAFHAVPSYLHSLGNAIYEKNEGDGKNLKISKRIKHVLIVDDSKTVRNQLKKILKASGFIVSECTCAADADGALRVRQFDLITLDLHMPGESGISWLKRNRTNGLKTPVVIVSDASPQEAERVFGALEDGADEYIVKGTLQTEDRNLGTLFSELAAKEKSSITGSMSNSDREIQFYKKGLVCPEIILLGASTGGPDAIAKLLVQLPPDLPPLVVVQHICNEFSSSFAKRVSSISGLKLGEIGDKKPLNRNTVYLATGDYHLELEEHGGQFFLNKNNNEKYAGHRPSVNTLFHSAARCRGEKLAILLTGMGDDGAKGMLELFRSGNCFNIVQNEQSSVVYGMPKVAKNLGGAHMEGDLQKIRAETWKRVAAKNAKVA